MDAGKVAEAALHQTVEGGEGIGLRFGGVATHAVDHTREPRTSSQETEAHLWVLQFSNRFQQLAGLGHPRRSVLADVRLVADGCTQELKVVCQNTAASVCATQQGSRKVRLKELHIGGAKHHQLALAEVKFEADVCSSPLGELERSAQGRNVTSEHAIIKEVHCEVQSATAQLRRQWLQGYTEYRCMVVGRV